MQLQRFWTSDLCDLCCHLVHMQWCLCIVAVAVALQGCTRQAALERRDLSCTYPAHHQPESNLISVY